MKIIFLDIDGVLNDPETYNPIRSEDTLLRIPVKDECIAHLNALVARTGAKVVISSSWRLYADYTHLGPALARHGVVAEVIGETPRQVDAREYLLEEGFDLSDALPRMYERGMDIVAYLLQHPEVEAFVVLDDDRDMWRVHRAFVHTNGAEGLTERDIVLAEAAMARSGKVLAEIREEAA